MSSLYKKTISVYESANIFNAARKIAKKEFDPRNTIVLGVSRNSYDDAAMNSLYFTLGGNYLFSKITMSQIQNKGFSFSDLGVSLGSLLKKDIHFGNTTLSLQWLNEILAKMEKREDLIMSSLFRGAASLSFLIPMKDGKIYVMGGISYKDTPPERVKRESSLEGPTLSFKYGKDNWVNTDFFYTLAGGISYKGASLEASLEHRKEVSIASAEASYGGNGFKVFAGGKLNQTIFSGPIYEQYVGAKVHILLPKNITLKGQFKTSNLKGTSANVMVEKRF
jgi:hypothetical protein